MAEQGGEHEVVCDETFSLPLSVLGAQGRSLPGELQAGQQVDSHCQEEQRSECTGQPAHYSAVGTSV